VFNWEVLIVPLIALAVWILSTIFRSVEEQRQANRPEPGGPPRRPMTELERFLDEARRRRGATENPEVSQASAGPAIEAPLPAIPLAMPVRPEERPSTEGLLRKERKPRPRQMPVASPPPRRSEEPIVAPPAMRMPEPSPPATVTPAPPVVRPGKEPAAPAGVRPGARLSPLVARLKGSLKDRESLRVAFLLGEVLGPPLCQRQARRP